MSNSSGRHFDRSLLHLLHRAGQQADLFLALEMQGADLTPRQLAVLHVVSQERDVSQTGIGERTGIDRSTLADIVRRLVEKGLLERQRTRRDARTYAIRLTDTGKSALAIGLPAAERAEQRIMSLVDRAAVTRLVEELEKIVDADIASDASESSFSNGLHAH